MVTIVDYKLRSNKVGEEFYALMLEGDIELVKSATTGNFYATARRTSITSTFNEATCKSLIGKQLPGTIKKVECEPYEYVDQDTGELVELNHRYVYDPEPSTVEETVFEKELVE